MILRYLGPSLNRLCSIVRRQACSPLPHLIGVRCNERYTWAMKSRLAATWPAAVVGWNRTFHNAYQSQVTVAITPRRTNLTANLMCRRAFRSFGRCVVMPHAHGVRLGSSTSTWRRPASARSNSASVMGVQSASTARQDLSRGNGGGKMWRTMLSLRDATGLLDGVGTPLTDLGLSVRIVPAAGHCF